MINFRVANESDAEVLAILGRVTYNESHGHFIPNKTHLREYNDAFFAVDKIKNDLKNKNNIFFIAYANDFPVGYAKLVLNFPNEYIDSSSIIKLERIYILEDFIGQKIGSQFMNHILEYSKKLNIENIYLAVYIKNENAIKFYEKYGFKNVGDITFKVGESSFPNHVFAKNLQL